MPRAHAAGEPGDLPREAAPRSQVGLDVRGESSSRRSTSQRTGLTASVAGSGPDHLHELVCLEALATGERDKLIDPRKEGAALRGPDNADPPTAREVEE